MPKSLRNFVNNNENPGCLPEIDAFDTDNICNAIRCCIILPGLTKTLFDTIIISHKNRDT